SGVGGGTGAAAGDASSSGTGETASSGSGGTMPAAAAGLPGNGGAGSAGQSFAGDSGAGGRSSRAGECERCSSSRECLTGFCNSYGTAGLCTPRLVDGAAVTSCCISDTTCFQLSGSEHTSAPEPVDCVELSAGTCDTKVECVQPSGAY